MAAGIHYFGPRIFRAKSTAAIDTLENDVRAVISWSEANNRQLANSANFPKIIPDPTDPYGQPLYYIYDNNLTSLSSGGLCGRSFTTLSVNFYPNPGASPTTQISNVAFVVLSSGPDLKVETVLSGTFNGSSINGPVSGSGYANGTVSIYSSGATIAAAGGYPYDDITRIVTLNELQARAHCAGVTRGRLMLLNNELPSACAGSWYAATLYPDGGVPDSSGNYTWSEPVLPSWLSASGSPNRVLWLTGTAPASAGTNSVTIQLQDYDNTPNVVLRNYVLSVINCGAGSGITAPPNTVNNAPVSGGTVTGINTNPTASNSASNSAATTAFANNVVTNVSGGGTNSGVIAAQNNVLTFGYNITSGEACVWFPYNFPLLGKIFRAFWNFCFRDIETPYPAGNTSGACNTCPNCTSCPWCSVNCTNCTACTSCTTTNACPGCSAASAAASTCFADGYTFTLMQAYNPTSYCGSGTVYDAALNPYYDCSDLFSPNFNGAGHLGEFMSYCGLPGYSMATEFDIYPNSGTNSRNDPSGNYNHVAMVQSITSHNFGTTPSCSGYCSGTCTGYCNGVSGWNAACPGQCWTGTTGSCSGACNTSLYGDNTHGTATVVNGNPACTTANLGSSGCLYNAPGDINGVTNSAVTWMEDGCNPGYTSHNARVEVHTRCNSTCSSCDNTSNCSSPTYDFMKAWIDKGNSNLNADASNPDVSYCFLHPSAMNQVKVGFTEGTGASEQIGYIANFSAFVQTGCSLPSISTVSSPSSLLQTSGTCSGSNASCTSAPCICLTSGQLLAAQLTASGGTGNYTWNIGAANIRGVAASNLPAWLSLQTSGSCGSYTCTASSPCLCGNATSGNSIYNTLLVSVNDGCTSDCSNGYNTSSQSYLISVQIPPPPSCVLTANPTAVTYNGATNLTWTVAGGAANNASWSASPAPGGTCTSSNLLNQLSGGSCTTGGITTVGADIYTLTVNNTGGSNTCSATVNTTCPTILLSPASLPYGTVGVAYSQLLTASGGISSSYTWSYVSGLQGSGLTFNTSTHTLTGTPTTAGTYTVIIGVAGSSPCNTVQQYQYTLQIYAPPTCTLTATTNPVAYGGTTGLTWTVTGNPQTASWYTTSPYVTPPGCGSPSAAGGSCTTSGLTTPGANQYALTVTNPAGSHTCAATTVYVGCQSYGVWDNYNTHPFMVGSTCMGNLTYPPAVQITNATNLLTTSVNVYRCSSGDNTCSTCSSGRPYMSYTDAMNADVVLNGGSGSCQVCWDSDSGGGSGDSAVTGDRVSGTCH
jgi:hypothetical protein